MSNGILIPFACSFGRSFDRFKCSTLSSFPFAISDIIYTIPPFLCLFYSQIQLALVSRLNANRTHHIRNQVVGNSWTIHIWNINDCVYSIVCEMVWLRIQIFFVFFPAFHTTIFFFDKIIISHRRDVENSIQKRPHPEYVYFLSWARFQCFLWYERRFFSEKFPYVSKSRSTTFSSYFHILWLHCDEWIRKSFARFSSLFSSRFSLFFLSIDNEGQVVNFHSLLCLRMILLWGCAATLFSFIEKIC